MKPPTLREYLDAQITRCCELLGHHPESDKIDATLKRAYDAEKREDWYAMFCIKRELELFK